MGAERARNGSDRYYMVIYYSDQQLHRWVLVGRTWTAWQIIICNRRNGFADLTTRRIKAAAACYDGIRHTTMDQFSKTIQDTTDRVVETLSNKQDLQRIGKIVSISVAAYFVTTVRFWARNKIQSWSQANQWATYRNCTMRSLVRLVRFLDLLSANSFESVNTTWIILWAQRKSSYCFV